MIVLYQFEISPFCDKIRRVMNYKQVPYELREVSLLSATTGYRKVNPVGKVPCLDHEGRLVADSTDIAHYLEEAFPSQPLIPKEPRDRALCHVLEDWADESLYFYESRLRFTLPHNAKRWLPELVKYDPAALRGVEKIAAVRTIKAELHHQGVGRKPVDTVLRDLERHVESIAAHLGSRDWLVGDAITLADIGVFAQMFCIRGADEGKKLIDASPAVSAWMDRVDRTTARAS